MRNNYQTADPVRLGEQEIEEVSEIIYSQGDKRWKHRGWNQDNDQQGKGGICGSEEHLEDEKDQHENKDTHFQEQRTDPLPLPLCGYGPGL